VCSRRSILERDVRQVSSADALTLVTTSDQDEPARREPGDPSARPAPLADPDATIPVPSGSEGRRMPGQSLLESGVHFGRPPTGGVAQAQPRATEPIDIAMSSVREDTPSFANTLPR
jgi:hypothetical protein